MITVFEFTGTAKDFAESGIYLNGKALDKITVGNLAKHGLIETVGEGDKPTRGVTPKLFKAVSRADGSMLFSKGE